MYTYDVFKLIVANPSKMIKFRSFLEKGKEVRNEMDFVWFGLKILIV